MKISLIIAIFNRKDELQELLQSLTQQTVANFEVVVVDDGSTENLVPTIEEFKHKLEIQYFKKANEGPGLTRNFGTKKAHGDFFLFIDSDCIAPENYIENILQSLKKNPVDAFGGADLADAHFNDLQKAISFSMTSFLTTGGIRGKKKSVTKFQPRSFNMGVSREAFEAVGGFQELRIGEDPDLSMRLWENGFTTAFFEDVKVFHKRRNSLKSFAKQVYQFGIARPILNQRHPQYKKWVFWFPSMFLIGLLGSILLYLLSFTLKGNFYPLNLGSLWINASNSVIVYLLSLFLLSFFILYFIAIFLFSAYQNKSLKVGFLSVITTLLQHCCYGFGFLKSFFYLTILKKKAKDVFPKHFYEH